MYLVAAVLQIKVRAIVVYNSKFVVDFRYLFLVPVNLLRRANNNDRKGRSRPTWLELAALDLGSRSANGHLAGGPFISSRRGA